MIYYITVLRALAACIIINSHYGGIYPNDIFANGGLLGNIIFFAISGYCLCNIGQRSFLQWFPKRVIRCFLPVWVMTAVYFLVGRASFSDHSFIWWFVWPTNFFFISQIVLLYIPFFCIFRTNAKNYLPHIMACLAIVYFLIYFVCYDKSFYHIDTVNEPFILFLYFESMLLGAFFRINDERFRNQYSPFLPILTVCFAGIYFASKLMFVNNPQYSFWQFANQLSIFILLYFIFRTFSSIDPKLNRLPQYAKKPIGFLADRTIELYVVQFLMISIAERIGHFPMNWFVATGTTLLSATLLHWLCKYVYSSIEKVGESYARKKPGRAD